METIRFVDTTIRDGHQSLWAENMTTGMMLPIAKNLDDAGFEGIELISGSHLKKTVRELKEDPWERVRLVAKIITKTPLRLIAGRVNTFEYNPPSMYRLFVERMFANGIKEARISDEWNDYEGWKFRVGECHRAGMKSILNLIYSVSPKHSDEYFALRTRQAASLKPYRLCLKDPGGLLTPERMETLVPIIFKNANGIPVELHTHCTTGLGPLCCIKGMELGIRSINTALPPLADDSSNPSLFNVAKNARALGYQPTSTKKFCSRYRAISPPSPSAKASPSARRWSTIIRSISTKCPAACFRTCAFNCARSAWKTSFPRRWKKRSACAKNSATRSWSHRCRSSSAARRRSMSLSASATRKSPTR